MLDSPKDVCAGQGGSNIQLLPYPLVTSLAGTSPASGSPGRGPHGNPHTAFNAGACPSQDLRREADWSSLVPFDDAPVAAVASASSLCSSASRMFLMFPKVFVDELNGGGAFADGRGDALDRAVAAIAGGEHAPEGWSPAAAVPGSAHAAYWSRASWLAARWCAGTRMRDGDAPAESTDADRALLGPDRRRGSG
jgi:hypothetical protein